MLWLISKLLIVIRDFLFNLFLNLMMWWTDLTSLDSTTIHDLFDDAASGTNMLDALQNNVIYSNFPHRLV
ncbi:MAG: hypothetical protein LUE14_05305 [Clostridiales bacterium]|nr:hypothetical protein [Clostridiales bacterium]